jgi:hypothetical protein
MLTIIGLLPTDYALNVKIGSQQIAGVAGAMPTAADLIERFGDDQKRQGIEGAHALGDRQAKSRQPNGRPCATI